METGPPTLTQPQSTLNDGWRKTTLTVPTDIIPKDIVKDGPIAPPRRKRSSMSPAERAGFKELFGNNVSRRSSCDSILNSERPSNNEKAVELWQQKRKSKSISNFYVNEVEPNKIDVETKVQSVSAMSSPPPATETSTVVENKSENGLQRKISRVGNKKSDKFFGENLSDCLSDEPITPEPASSSDVTDLQIIQKINISSAENKPVVAPRGSKDKLDIFIDQNTPVQNVNEIIQDKVIELSPIEINDQINVVTIADDVNIIVDDSLNEEHNDSLNDDLKSSLDKKAEFLMAMLDDNKLYKDSMTEEVVLPPKRRHSKQKLNEKLEKELIVSNVGDANFADNNVVVKSAEFSHKSVEDDAEYYKGMTPVEEPIIIPRRRPSKHICDDDNHLHDYIHSNHNHSHENIAVEKKNNHRDGVDDLNGNIRNINEQIITPKKPKRDFNIYEKTMSQQNATVLNNVTNRKSHEEKPKPKVRHLSQENLFQRLHSTPVLSLHPIQTLKSEKIGDEKLETILKKCKSQQSFLTQELMNEIADRVYGFQDPYEIDDHDTYDDCSSKVSPNSKLTTRKISVARKDSSTVPPIQESLVEDQNHQSVAELEMKPTEIVSTSKNSIAITHMEPSVQSDRSVLLYVELNENKQNTVDFLNMERLNSQSLLNTNTNPKPIQQPINIVAEIERVLQDPTTDDKAIAHVLDDIYKSNSSILDEFQRYLNDSSSSISDKLSDITITNSDSLHSTSSDDDNTGSDITVREVKPNKENDTMTVEAHNKILEQLRNGEPRQRHDSIVEVDEWFLRHKDDPPNIQRRDSASTVGYDTRKVFPFGKSDSGAGSSFFEGKTLSKSAENISDQNYSNLTNSKVNTATDHSTLLKYLK